MPCIFVNGFDDPFWEKLRRRKQIGDFAESADRLFVWDSIALAAELAHDAFSFFEPTAKIVEIAESVTQRKLFGGLPGFCWSSQAAGAPTRKMAMPLIIRDDVDNRVATVPALFWLLFRA